VRALDIFWFDVLSTSTSATAGKSIRAEPVKKGEAEMKQPLRRVATNRVAFMAVVILLATSSGSSAIASNPQTTEQAGARVDAIFADLQKLGSPGCALGVFRDGHILYAKGYGLASVEGNTPITPQTIFDIGSTSKQFTAASIVLLEQQGKLSVNDDVRKYIPELPDYSKEYGRKITILNLLNHTSGLRDYLDLLQFSGVNEGSVTTDVDALALIVRQRHLDFAPGSEWAYSNTGYFLLSVIVKRVSGMTLRQFASQNIFQPLGMTHTIFRDDHTQLIPNRALAYDLEEKRGYQLDVSYFEQTGDGAVHISVEDFGKWDENFYSGQVGGKSFLAEMQQPGQLNDGKALDYAKGLFIQNYRGLQTVSHDGSWGGYRAELVRFPNQHFSVVCLCNLGNAAPEKRARKVAGVYLGDLMKPEEHAAKAEHDKKPTNITLVSGTLATYAGDFESDELGVVYRLRLVDGKLNLVEIAEPSGIPRTGMSIPELLRPTGTDEFEISGPETTMRFLKNANNEVGGFNLGSGRPGGIEFRRTTKMADIPTAF
jgi:CubicO group peptidase (beta-lactamase class C family)